MLRMVSGSAIKRTVILLSAMLLMTAAWGIDRIPEANLLMIVFTFLASAFLADVKKFNLRLLKVVIWASYGSAAQFLISVSGVFPLLQTIIAMGLAYFTFSTLTDHRVGCVVMITGYLAFLAPPGFEAAVGRSFDIFVGAVVIMAVTTLGSIGTCEDKALLVPDKKYSHGQALMLSAELGIGNLLANMLQLKQGSWIMLTILFIRMCMSSASSGRKLALQRIFAIPIGVVVGGFLLGTFCRMDYRFVFLVPFVGALGFFVLYNYGDFFLFSIIFMAALTVASDWIAGPYQRINLWESFFARSISTGLGTLLELLFLNRQSMENGDTA